MDQAWQQIQPGLKKPRIGSREGFDRLWASRRAEIISVHCHVAASIRLGAAAREEALERQRQALRALDSEVDRTWQGPIGEIWRWLGRVDLGLLEKQLGDLALIQADDLRKGSKKWETVEGVMNLLGELGDLLRGLEANNGHGRSGGQL